MLSTNDPLLEMGLESSVCFGRRFGELLYSISMSIFNKHNKHSCILVYTVLLSIFEEFLASGDHEF